MFWRKFPFQGIKFAHITLFRFQFENYPSVTTKYMKEVCL